MKTLIKLFSIAMLLITSMTFAQYGPDGCILLPDPFKDLIKSQIPKTGVPEEFQNVLHTERMISYLEAFNSSFNQFQNEEVPQEFVDRLDETPEDYRLLTNSLVAKSSNFEELKSNILTRLQTAETLEEAEALILFNYQIQIVENSEAYRDGNNSLDWRCISTSLGYAATNVMSNPNDSIDDFGNSGGGIAGGGCTPTFNPPPRFCK